DAVLVEKSLHGPFSAWRVNQDRSGRANPGRVRVAVMALFRIGSLFTLRVETLAAAAGGPVVRVAHEEPAARDALRVVNARAVEVVLAVPVDEDLETMDLDDLIAILDFPVQCKTVSEPGASTAGHVHPEVRILGGSQRLSRLRVVPLDELLDLVRRRFCERDLNHCRSPRLSKTITPLFNPLRTVFATLTDPRSSPQRLPHVPPFRPETQALVHMAGALVPFPDLELDLPVPAFPRPIACAVAERLADALVPVIRRDPDVIEERVRLRRQEPALAEDHVAEGLAGRPFRDPPF